MKPAVVAVALWLAGAGPAFAAADLPFSAGLFQGLDKVTARIVEFTAPVGIPVTFGALEITVLACMETPPTEPPESAAFVQISDLGVDETVEPRQVFSGWMFASSPGLSALEHPVYDVWVIDCEGPIEPDDEAAGAADG